MLASWRVSLSALFVVVISCMAQGQRPTPKAQEVFAPYWTSAPGWETELRLKNNLASGSLTVTPVLRSASGQEIPLDPVTLASNSSTSVWVNAGLLTHAPTLLSRPGSYGSVIFRFNSPNARNLHATANLLLHGGPIAFQVDAYPTAASEAPSRAALAGSQEGIWWQPRPAENDVLILSNSSANILAGTLWLSDAAGKRWSQRFDLTAYQTLQMDLRELIATSGLTGSYGGIQLETSANGRDLRSIHFTYDEGANTWTFFKMFDREPNARLQERIAPVNSRPWTMWAPMLALQSPDPGLGLPPGTILQPTIFVRNTTAKTLPASITLNWRGDSGKGQVKLPTLSFAPFATQQIQIGSMQKQLGIPDDAHWALVTLSTSGMPDDLMAMASSYDASGQDNLQTIFSDLLIGHLAGGEWRADAAHDELISITNGGAKATDALLTLHYDNGQTSYEMQQTIPPGEQMWVNVADLIHNRVADRKGSVLPPDLTAGTFDVTDLSPGPGSLTEGSLSLDKTAGSQIIPNTPDCCGDSDPVFDPGSLDVIVNGLEDFGFYGYNQCSDTEVDISASITSWASSNTAIAAVTKRQVQGVSPGSAFAEGYGKVLICEGNREALIPVAPQAPVTVAQYNVSYSAYIPVDHVSAPPTSFCTYKLSPYIYTYMGDANRGTYRTTESILVEPDGQTDSGFFAGAGQTRQYGAFSPKNGSTLSSLDEDGVAKDCYLWNNAQTANTSGLQYDVSFPYAHQGQVHYDGSASNPLESSLASIQWDMRTVIDTTNPSKPTAIVNYNHTCYPSHQIKVNGQVVYLYTPTRNDSVYIAGCLTGILAKITGQQSAPIQVPPY